jgi:hypothetical protein
MTKGLKIFIITISAAATFAGLAVANHYIPNKPDFLQLVDDKLVSIITAKPPIGDLSVVRDLEGTWKSSLSGKGLQVYGKFSVGGGTTTVYEDGDIDLIIEEVKGNTATGKMRIYNLCAYGQATFPKLATVNIPKTCTGDSGYSPISIHVSGTQLDFGSGSAAGVNYSMQGTYTTDLISGTMTINLPAYGALKGEFKLMRQK